MFFLCIGPEAADGHPSPEPRDSAHHILIDAQNQLMQSSSPHATEFSLSLYFQIWFAFLFSCLYFIDIFMVSVTQCHLVIGCNYYYY